MPTHTTISTHKIIVLVAFICAAIMTSLFVFRLSHKPQIATLAANQGLTFPAGRDIKPFELKTTNNESFSQKNFNQHWTLVFFGFTHCSTICPTTLDMLQRAYTALHSSYPSLQVVLISLDPERDTPNALATYTHTFNPAFIGVTGNIQTIRKLQSQLGIFAARDDATTNNDQIQHTSSILLINPQGRWVGLFNASMTPTQLTQAFTSSVASLTQENRS